MNEVALLSLTSSFLCHICITVLESLDVRVRKYHILWISVDSLVKKLDENTQRRNFPSVRNGTWLISVFLLQMSSLRRCSSSEKICSIRRRRKWNRKWRRRSEPEINQHRSKNKWKNGGQWNIIIDRRFSKKNWSCVVQRNVPNFLMPIC